MNMLRATYMKDNASLYILYQVVNKYDFEKIANAKSSKEVRDILEKAYKGVIKWNRFGFKHSRESWSAWGWKRLREWPSTLLKLKQWQTIGRNGEMLPTSCVVEKILRSLIENFKNAVCVIKESKDLPTLLVEDLVTSLKVHKQRKKKKWKPLKKLLQMKWEDQNTQGRRWNLFGIWSGYGGRSWG